MEQYKITGMSCAACQVHVEKAVQKIPGVNSVNVSLLTNSMAVDGTASSDQIVNAVKNAGYGAIPFSKKTEETDSREIKDPLWRVELAFDLTPLGPLHVQAQLLRGSLSGQLWAERASTAHLIESQLGDLRQRLNDAGLSVTDLDCHQGTPPQSGHTALEQRWVDETA